jgi:hypothetical protein
MIGEIHLFLKRIHKGLLILWLLLAVFLWSAYPPSALAGADAATLTCAKCIPSFPDKDGWYGGDGAYSIRLDPRRTLWLFGDTFVSTEEGKQDRVDMDVIMGTTLAISTCSPEGKFNIQYFLKKKEGKFVSSFGEHEWLWPQDPFIVEKAASPGHSISKTLYIPLLVVEARPQADGALQFGIIGNRLARINDFKGQDPNQWTVTYIDLTPAIPGQIQSFATTSVVYGQYVYFYPVLGISGNMLARIPLEKIDQPAAAIEYLAKDGIWEKGLNPTDARIVLDAAVSELSVRYHEDRKKWIAVYMALEKKGDKLLYRESDRLEGPWSPPAPLIINISAVDPKSSQYDRNTICYAGKEHSEFSKGAFLVTTYVCNSLADIRNRLSFIRKNLFLYRPVVNVVPY